MLQIPDRTATFDEIMAFHNENGLSVAWATEQMMKSATASPAFVDEFAWSCDDDGKTRLTLLRRVKPASPPM